MAVVLGLLVLTGLLAASSTRAGELAYRGCVTSVRALGPSGSGVCHKVPGPGLTGPGSVALSPDGSSLYTSGFARIGSPSVHDVARLDRDATTGALTYRGCITGSNDPGASGPGACRKVRSSSGFGGDVTGSADGRSVYAIGFSSVARFDRNPTTGGLTYRGCITGGAYYADPATGGCEAIPTATFSGGGSGMDQLTDVAVSPDGKSLYITSRYDFAGGDAALTRFDRDPGSGALSWRGCISGDTMLGPAGSGACELIPSAHSEALNSGLDPTSLSVSPDGKSLYTASWKGCAGGAPVFGCIGSWGVARFDRNPTTGALAYRGCITGDKRSGPSGSGACTAIRSASKNGENSGLRGSELAASPDGKSLYLGGDAVAEGDVARFDRNPTSGALTYRGCITGSRELGPSGSGACHQIPSATENGDGSGLTSVFALATSPDGKTLYAGGGSQVTRLHRDTTTGALKFRDCITGDRRSGPAGSGACTAIPSATKHGNGSGLGRVAGLAPSQDGKSLYSAGCCTGKDLVARFGFAPQTRIARARTRGHRAVFHFRAGKPSRYECKLKGKRVRPRLRHWRHCGSNALRSRGAERYRGLHRGKKVFRVRATDEIGNTDPTPAKRRWRVR